MCSQSRLLALAPSKGTSVAVLSHSFALSFQQTCRPAFPALPSSTHLRRPSFPAPAKSCEHIHCIPLNARFGRARRPWLADAALDASSSCPVQHHPPVKLQTSRERDPAHFCTV